MKQETFRIKISSDLFFAKVVILGLIGFAFLFIADYPRTKDPAIIEQSIIFFSLLLILLYLFTRPDLYHDKFYLYIQQGKSESQIPLSKIHSIKFSVLGFRPGSYSYKIKYYDNNNELKSTRLFPRMGSKYASDFIDTIKVHNPNIKVRNWSFGVEEIFD